jgi:hypothetical protein
MNSAAYVASMVDLWKQQGVAKDMIVWQTAKLCVGYPYVFGAWGAYCTVAERKKRYREDHPTIKTACKAYDGGSCNGCKWFPNGERVRCYDCRGFTDWCLNRVGIDLIGEGCRGQWNGDNWVEKGTIDTMPANTLVCLFVYKAGKWAHTGLGYNNETVECSAGVQYFQIRKPKWTHWALPKGLYDTPPTPVPPTPTYPTIRKGSVGEYVKKAQELLISKGYDLAPYGADGKFGNKTLSAVKAFQKANNLGVDGIIGKQTWKALLA